MKRTSAFLLLLILIFSATSCNFKNNKSDTVKIDNKEYIRASIGQVYPVDNAFIADGGEKISGNTYFGYPNGKFDCYISYGDDGEPNLYFESKKQDEILAYYNDPKNYNYFCLIGNANDENNQQIFKLDGIEHSMFDGLMKCIYNKAGFMPMPVTNDDWVADEIHFYKESKDGAFSTSKGNTFIMRERKMYVIGYYDFSDDDAPVMHVKEVPSDVSNYFCGLIENINK